MFDFFGKTKRQLVRMSEIAVRQHNVIQDQSEIMREQSEIIARHVQSASRQTTMIDGLTAINHNMQEEIDDLHGVKYDLAKLAWEHGAKDYIEENYPELVEMLEAEDRFEKLAA